MLFPTIHMNGTARGHLIEQYRDAAAAMDNAIAHLRNAAPNGRDYYPQGADAARTAQQEHSARLQAMDLIRDQMQSLAEHVSEAEG